MTKQHKEPFFTFVTFTIIFVNVVAYIVQHIIPSRSAIRYFALSNSGILHGRVWQFLTYSFMHGDFFHLLINMFLLFMFGLPVEAEVGRRRFCRYYLICAIGAGITIFISNMFTGISPIAVTFGASGAIFGVMLAFAMLFPNAVVLFWFFPMRAKTMIALYAVFEIYHFIKNNQPGISNIGHLGGLLTGIIFFYVIRRYYRSRSFARSAKIVKEKIVKQNENDMLKISILQKLKDGKGKDALTDDEWQLLKYMEIMGNNKGKFEVDGESMTDEEFLSRVKVFISI